MQYRWVNVSSRFARRVALAGSRAPYLLVIQTVRGSYLPYLGVRPEVFWQMVRAPSKGGFYNAYIKGLYPRADLEPAEDESDSLARARALWASFPARPGL